MELDKIVCMDALEYARSLPGNSIDCIVTSPPYYALRNYGTDGQWGLEDTPELYIERMVELFGECRRALKDEGTLWLNLGDSFAANRGYQVPDGKYKDVGNNHSATVPQGYKPKDLMFMPHRVAMALQSDGWYTRMDIVWYKPNAMPESVSDRPTKAHEYIFLMSKSPRYFYDADAIREPQKIESLERTTRSWNGDGMRDYPNGPQNHMRSYMGKSQEEAFALPGRNKRSVWTVSTKPYSEAHFATFPPDLIEPCILAGCPSDGVVYDPFMGAGTSALVAIQHGRHYVGSEINPDYVALAQKRIAEFDPYQPTQVDEHTQQLSLFGD